MNTVNNIFMSIDRISIRTLILIAAALTCLVAYPVVHYIWPVLDAIWHFGSSISGGSGGG